MKSWQMRPMSQIATSLWSVFLAENTHTVDDLLRGPTTPLVNAVRVVFRQADSRLAGQGPDQVYYYELDQLIVSLTPRDDHLPLIAWSLCMHVCLYNNVQIFRPK